MNIYQKKLNKIVDIVESNNCYHIFEETKRIVREQNLNGMDNLMVLLDIYEKLKVSRYKIKKVILKEVKETGQVSIASVCNKLNIKI